MTERYGYDKTPTPAIDYDVSKVPPEIKKRTTWVKTKYTGEDVAEAYGQVGDIAGIYAGEAKQLAERTQIRQDAVEDFNAQVIQEMTDKDVISAPEIIQMRDGEATANERLERDLTSLNRLVNQYGYRTSSEIDPDIADATAQLQNIIDRHDVVIIDIPMWIDGVVGIKLRSNTKIIFDTKGELRVLPNDQDRYTCLDLTILDNVIIQNPKLIGDRLQHIGTTGEHGIGIRIRGSSNISIDNPVISNFWGDAILVGRGPEPGFVKPANISIRNVNLDNNRRQGISVTSVDGLLISGGSITNTNGTAPSSAIDLEPDEGNQLLDNVLIENIVSKGNAGYGMLIALHTYSGWVDNTLMNITIRNFTSINDGGYSLYIRGPVTGIKGVINIDNYTSIRSRKSAMFIRELDKDQVTLNINNPTIIDANTDQIAAIAEGSDITFIKLNADRPDLVMGNIFITNPKFIRSSDNPRVAHKIAFFNQPNQTDLSVFNKIKLVGMDETKIFMGNGIKESTIDFISKDVATYEWDDTNQTLGIPNHSYVYDEYQFSKTKASTFIIGDSTASFEREVTVINLNNTGSIQSIIPPSSDYYKFYPTQFANGIKTTDFLAKLSIERYGRDIIITPISGSWTAV